MIFMAPTVRPSATATKTGFVTKIPANAIATMDFSVKIAKNVNDFL